MNQFRKSFQGIGRTRELVRIRDNHTCQDCKKIWKNGERRFDIHHLNGLCGKLSRKYDKVSTMEGLVTLCHKCHMNRPENRIRSPEYLQLMALRRKIPKEDYKTFHFLRKDGYTLKEIGAKYRVTKQRISQIILSYPPHELDPQ